MKTALFVSMILITVVLVLVLSFATDATQSSETISSVIIPLTVMYGLFGVVLFIIGKKGHDLILSR
jgi:hypothetical protein